jgi:DMSO/TMAO reductase YedYZ molybdopterin-dependent catalytic subunit
MDEKETRVVEARLRLRERFLEKMRRTPAQSDGKPMGSGPPNRHGMPRLPPGQTRTEKWPVLDLGRIPQVPLAKWRFVVVGAAEQRVELDWAGLLALPQVEDVSDFHCVTGWSRLDVPWKGVRVADVLALARPRPEATHLLAHAFDGYTTNVPLEEALKDDVLLVHGADGGPLPVEHGGPVRMITPQLWAWKGAKWVSAFEVLAGDRRGFWEERGYSNTAHPWRNDRYDE